MNTSSRRDDTIAPKRRGVLYRPRKLFAGTLAGMMGLLLAIPSSHADIADDRASAAINIHRKGEESQQSGTDFQYQIDVSCSDVGGAGMCDEASVFIPFDNGIDPDWNMDAQSGDTDLSITPEKETDGFRIHIDAPIPAGESTNFMFTVRPPNGWTPNNTEWSVAPRLEYSSNGTDMTNVAGQPVRSVATAEPRGNLAKRFSHDESGGEWENTIAVLPGDTLWMRLSMSIGGGSSGRLNPESTVITDALPEGLELDDRHDIDDEDVEYDASTRTIKVAMDQDRLLSASMPPPVIPLRVTSDVPSGEEVQIRNDATAMTKYIGQDELVEYTSNARVNVAQFVPDGTLFSKEFTSNKPEGFQPGGLTPDVLLTDAQTNGMAYYDLRMRHSAQGDYDAAMFDALPCYSRENSAGGYSSPSPNGHQSSPCQDGVMDLKTLRFQTPGTYSVNSVDVVLHMADGSTEEVTMQMNGGRLSQTVEVEESWDVAAVEVRRFTVPSNTSGERVFLRLGFEMPADDRLEHADIIRNSGYGAVAPVGGELGDFEPYTADAQVWKPKPTVTTAIRDQHDVIDSEGNSLESPPRWGLWHDTRLNVDPADPIADLARRVFLLPPASTGITINESQMERQWSEPFGDDFTYHEDYQGTGRPALEVRGAHDVDPPTRGSLKVSGATPGAYPIDIYVGYDGQSANEAECLRSTVGPDSAYNKDATVTTPDFWPVSDTGVCHISGAITLTTLTDSFHLDKEIRQDEDGLWEGYTGEPLITGGAAEYRLQFANTGPNDLQDIVLYDMLPAPGDTGTVAGQINTGRGSTGRGILTEPVEAPEGFTVYYSTSDNPQRERVNPDLEGTVDDWTTDAPADLSTVTAIRLDGGDTRLGTGETISTVINVELEDAQGVAWNTVSGDADVAGQPGTLLPVEPRKVGFRIAAEPGIVLEKNEPGDDRHEVESGEHSVTVKFTNDGNEDLTDFVFTDTTESGNDAVWNQGELDGLTDLVLAPGESYEVTGTVQVDKGVTHRDVATIEASGVISGDPVESDDPTTYVPEDPVPDIEVSKNDPGDDYHEVDSGVHDVVVTIENTGEESLTDFVFTDNTESGEDVIWDAAMLKGLESLVLQPGDSYHVRGRVDVHMGTAHRDTVHVAANGVISGDPVESDDPTTLVPEDPETGIVVEKNEAGDDVHDIESGNHQVVVNFTNSGTEALTDFVFTDTTESGEDVVWNEDDLAALGELTLQPGESFNITGEVEVIMGTKHRDVATVEATGIISGDPVEDDDPTTLVPEDPDTSLTVEKNEAGDDVHDVNPGNHQVVVNFSNDGTEALTDFVFTDITESGQDVVWNEDDLAGLEDLTLEPGESYQVTGTVDVVAGEDHRDTVIIDAVGVISGDPFVADDPTTLVPTAPVVPPAPEDPEAPEDAVDPDNPLAKTGPGTALLFGGIAVVLLIAGIAMFAYNRKRSGQGSED